MRRTSRPTSTSCWRSASAPPQPPEAPLATAIVAAAGFGERLGAKVPKAFVEAGGRTLLGWCLEALRAAETIGPIVVALPPGEPGSPGAGRITVAMRALFDPQASGVGGVVTVPGGALRSESVRAALELVETDEVVVHDAARPLARPELFDAVVEQLRSERCDAVVAAAPLTDTIKEAKPAAGGREVRATLDRSSLWAAQTPQAFRTDALRRALASTELLAQATDEAMLVERSGGRVLLHPAPAENIKVTSPLDLRVAELLLSEREGG